MPMMEILTHHEQDQIEDPAEVTMTIRRTSDPYRRFFVLKRKQELQGWNPQTRFYVDSTEFVKFCKQSEAIS